MDRTEENRQEYKELQRKVKREVSKAKQKAYDELYTRLDTREGEKDLYRLARQRDRDGKDVQQVRVIKDRDGRVLTSEESVQRRWKEYFEELMNEENEREKRVEGVNSVEQKVDKIRKDEVRKALKRMKSGKAVGPDDIPVEVWKCLGEAAVEFLTSLFNRVLESERMPEEWRRSVLVPIFKNKGDVQSCSNYRGIKLMSHTMKLWERVVEARLRKVVEICEQQYGFMPRKSTTDAIFALRILMEKYRDGQRELHCVFVDLEKAYDRVPREELWYCMRKSGVAEKYVRVVQDMYERSRTVVRCAVGQTEAFNVEVGLHQGLALSPFLFAIVMDQLSEEVRQESPWTMMFADDIVICSESREQVEENLERWRFALERRGMKVSRSKTEYMCVNEREGSGKLRLQGEEVKKVQEFKYLGSTVQSNGECGKVVKKRVQAGWNGWRKVLGVLCDRKISARIKGKVYRTVVRPAMLYGLETVSLRKRQESELELQCKKNKTQQEVIGECWCLMEFNGEYWCLMEFKGECWCLMEFSGECWCLMEFNGEYWCLMEFKGECWCLMEFKGECWCFMEFSREFWLLRQCPGESLSDFLRRMEKSLTKVIQRGGLSPAQGDKARVEQLIHGAVESDMMLLQFTLKIPPSGYYQIAVSEEDKEKTAFICPLAFYQFQRMPQGITGAPATFQRLMEKVVSDMHLLQVIVYLNDLIVFGRTLEEHEERLMKVLDRLEEWGLKVSIDKCQFCQPQVKYVGHIVSAMGVALDPEKVAAVNQWKEPTDLKSLRSFLGFCGFYWRFIKSYSTIVRPLTELTKGYSPAKRQSKMAGKQYYKEAAPFGERWDEACGEAFRKIIHCLTHSPVLAFADPALPYVLHIDASLSGLGAVLNQEHSDGLRPVAFASRKLNVSEQHYPIHQLEFLALKWAVSGVKAICQLASSPWSEDSTRLVDQPTQKSKWSQHITQLVHAYNCTKNEVTGYSPCYLLFGREAHLPIDVCFGISMDGERGVSHLQYVERMKTELQQAYQLAAEISLKGHQRNKRLYDQRVKPHMLTVGDRVLIRNLAVTGKHKLQDRWNCYLTWSLGSLKIYRCTNYGRRVEWEG
ncbi:hypothetical protein QTP70_005240 [Hemibagrus guttatus]|uniref:ribonuclease H n=1 Tax=Hemibagrus guttatus TaxID=175788 RepID=A0AAE0VDT5_9TELE|nr:hypothetical protein QTP70_005240 [Hemibagrus guttatus]